MKSLMTADDDNADDDYADDDNAGGDKSVDNCHPRTGHYMCSDNKSTCV